MSSSIKSPISWVPSSYLAEGIPFAMVVWASGTMFKDLGHSDSEITLAISSITVMWSLKPLYAGFLDMFKTKKFWVLTMEFLMAALLVLAGLLLSLEEPFWPIIGVLWLVAAASATQDICVDGVYITTLDKPGQARWIGWQGAFWVTGRIFATAAVVGIAGYLQQGGGMSAPASWTVGLFTAAGAMAALGIYHAAMLPSGSITERPKDTAQVVRTFLDQFIDFFRKPQIWLMLLFVFLYRSGEGFLLMEAPLFMQGGVDTGGLGLCATDAISQACPHSLSDKATIDGLVSTIISLVFGIAGGAYASKVGLKTRTLLIMAFCINVPNLTFVYLSQVVSPEAPVSLGTITALVTIEKAGYSFGFVANMLYMMQQISPGKYHMTHYAFCTALMNLVLLPTQAASGPLAEFLGFKTFFIFVCVATIPSFIAAAFAPFPNKPASQEHDGAVGSGASEPA